MRIIFAFICSLVAGSALTPAFAVDQFEFMKTVILAREQYNSADNDFQKAPLRAERKQAICALVGDNSSVTDWFGTLYELSATRSSDGQGKGKMVVDLGYRIYLQTADFWDFSDTQVETTDPLYLKLGALVEGSEIKFSGIFIKSDSSPDCIDEMSLTERGSMNSPEFVFKFTDISQAK